MKIIIDLRNRIISLHNVGCVTLTKLEAILLDILLGGKSNVITKDVLIKRVWGDIEGFEDNLVQLIHKVKRKLKRLEIDFLIANIRGHGYIFDKSLQFSVDYLGKKLISLDEKSFTPLVQPLMGFRKEVDPCDVVTILKIAIKI